MRSNVTVIETGQPMRGEYKGTRKKDGKIFVEVRYWNRQSRKWFKPEKVKLDSGVAVVYIEKGTDVYVRR